MSKDDENSILSTSQLQSLLHLLSLHVVSDNTTLRTSLSLEWITTRISPETFDKVIVHIFSVSEGRSVGRLVQDVQ